MGEEYYSIHPPEVVQMLHNHSPPSPLSSAPGTPIADHKHSKNAFSDSECDDPGVVNPPKVSRKLLPPSVRNPAYSKLPTHLTSPIPIMPPVGAESSTKKKKTFMKKADAPFDENPLSVPPLEYSATERTLRILKGEMDQSSSKRNGCRYEETPDDEISSSKNRRRKDPLKPSNRLTTKTSSKAVNLVDEAPDDERMMAFSNRNILAEMDDMEETVAVAKRNFLFEMDEMEEKIFSSQSYQSPKISTRVVKAESSSTNVRYSMDDGRRKNSCTSHEPASINVIDADPLDEHDELMIPKSPSQTRPGVIHSLADDIGTVPSSPNSHAVVSEHRDGCGIETGKELGAFSPLGTRSMHSLLAPLNLGCLAFDATLPLVVATAESKPSEMDTNIGKIQDVVSRDLVISDKINKDVTFSSMLRDAADFSTAAAASLAAAGMASVDAAGVAVEHMILGPPPEDDDQVITTSAIGGRDALLSVTSKDSDDTQVIDNLASKNDTMKEKRASSRRTHFLDPVTEEPPSPPPAPPSRYAPLSPKGEDTVWWLEKELKRRDREEKVKAMSKIHLEEFNRSGSLQSSPAPNPSRAVRSSPLAPSSPASSKSHGKRKLNFCVNRVIPVVLPSTASADKTQSQAGNSELLPCDSVVAAPAVVGNNLETPHDMKVKEPEGLSNNDAIDVKAEKPAVLTEGEEKKSEKGDAMLLFTAKLPRTLSHDSEVQEEKKEDDQELAISYAESKTDTPCQGFAISSSSAEVNETQDRDASPELEIDSAEQENTKSDGVQPNVNLFVTPSSAEEHKARNSEITQDVQHGADLVVPSSGAEEHKAYDNGNVQDVEPRTDLVVPSSGEERNAQQDRKGASDLYVKTVEHENPESDDVRSEVDLAVSSSGDDVYGDQDAHVDAKLNVKPVERENTKGNDVQVGFSSSEEQSGVKDNVSTTDDGAGHIDQMRFERDLPKVCKPNETPSIAPAAEKECTVEDSESATIMNVNLIEQDDCAVNPVENEVEHVQEPISSAGAASEVRLREGPMEAGIIQQESQTVLHPADSEIVNEDLSVVSPSAGTFIDSDDPVPSYDVVGDEVLVDPGTCDDVVEDEVLVSSSVSGEESVEKTGWSGETMSIASVGTEILSNKAPVLVKSLDDVDGICKGDIVLSLVRVKDPNAGSSPAQIHNAVWRMRIMRRCFTLRETGELSGDPSSYGVFGRGNSPFPVRNRSSLPVDVDNMRMVGALNQTRALEDSAIDHLRYDEFDDALELYDDILAAYEDAFKTRNWNESATEDGNFCIEPYIGNALYNKGIVNFLKEDYKEALTCFEEALKRRVSPHRKPKAKPKADELTTLVKIALCHFALGRFSKAHTALEVCLGTAKGYSKTITDFSQVAEILNNLGCLAFIGGDSDAAMQMFVEALKVQQSVVSHSLYSGSVLAGHSANLNISVVRANIAFLRLCDKDYRGAIVFFERSLASQQVLLYDSHETLLGTMDQLATSNQFAGDTDKAINMLERMLRALNQAHGLGDPRCEILRLKIGVLQSGRQNSQKGQPAEESVKDSPSEDKTAKSPPRMLRKFTLRKASRVKS